MEPRGHSRESGAMPHPRLAALALTLAPALASAGDLDAAMQCVRSTMTSALVPVTASAEQLANVALGRCADEIESAAIAMAGVPLVAARIDASRMAVRTELHQYALAVASGPAPATASDASRTPAW